MKTGYDFTLCTHAHIYITFSYKVMFVFVTVYFTVLTSVIWYKFYESLVG